jgi:hypothetical protein
VPTPRRTAWRLGLDVKEPQSSFNGAARAAQDRPVALHKWRGWSHRRLREDHDLDLRVQPVGGLREPRTCDIDCAVRSGQAPERGVGVLYTM